MKGQGLGLLVGTVGISLLSFAAVKLFLFVEPPGFINIGMKAVGSILCLSSLFLVTRKSLNL